MDLIYVRKDENDAVTSGFLKNYRGDFDVSTDTEQVSNDFAIERALPKDRAELLYEEGSISTFLYVEGEEYGGVIDSSVIDVSAGTITYKGRTWRGILSGYIIEPPAGQDYLIVSGNLAESLRLLPMGDWIEVEDTEYTGGTFQFDRYVPTFDGATKLLKAANAALRMSFSFVSEGSGGKAKLKLEEARDLTQLLEVSQDYSDKVKLKITRDGSTPRCMICLGQGELRDRQVIKLYADEDWQITQTPIAGAYPVDTYDFSSSENLLQDGMKHYAEVIRNHTQFEVLINGLDVRLSDIVAAKDQLTGETVTAEITKIIWKPENDGKHTTESFEYNTKVRL